MNGVVNVIFAIVSGCLFHFDNAYQQTTFDLDMSMKGLSGARSVSMRESMMIGDRVSPHHQTHSSLSFTTKAMDGPNAFFHSPYIWLAQDVLSLVLDSLGLTHAILQVRHYNLNIFRVGNNTIVDSNVI